MRDKVQILEKKKVILILHQNQLLITLMLKVLKLYLINYKKKKTKN